jgi:hypothetical protein
MTEPTADQVLLKAKQLAPVAAVGPSTTTARGAKSRRRRHAPGRISEPGARAAKARENLTST